MPTMDQTGKIQTQERAPIARSVSRKKLILFRVLAAVLPLLAIEAAARVYWSLFIFEMPTERQMADDAIWHQDWQKSPVLYAFRENDEFYVDDTPTRTNNLGLRGDEQIDLRAPYPGVRIVCIGDSVTFGYTVSGNSKAYPAVLEKILREKGVKCQVINGGMPRYRVDHMANLFEYRLPQIRPNLAIILGGWNDLADNILIRPTGLGTKAADSALKYLYTMRVANHVYGKFKPMGRAGQVRAGTRPEGFVKFERSLRWLIRLARQNGASPVLCTLPSFFATAKTEDARRRAGQYAPFGTVEQFAELTAQMNDRVRAVAAAESVPVCELVAVNDPDLFADPVHPNDAGSALMARTVADWLLAHPSLLKGPQAQSP